MRPARGSRQHSGSRKINDESKMKNEYQAHTMTTTGYLTVRLANMECQAKVDSGSDLNLISQSTFDNLPLHYRKKLKVKVSTAQVANQAISMTTGTLFLPLLIDKQFFKTKFTLFPASSCPIFLGKPFLRAAKAKVNHDTDTIKLVNSIAIHSNTSFYIDPFSEVICQARLQQEVPNDTIGICSYIPTINTKGILMAHTLGRAVDSTLPIRLYNGTNAPITINNGERLGSFVPCKDEDECIPFPLHDELNKYIPKIGNISRDITITKKGPIIDLSDTLLSEEEKARLIELVQEFIDCFVDPETKTIGLTDLVSAKIETYPNAVPITKYPYRMAPAMREELEKIVREQERLGLIEQTDSGAWASPALLVKKPSGGYRLVIDYRGLNAMTIPQVLRIPRLDDVLDAVGETKPKYFTVLDLTQGFHQIPLDEESRDKTSFLVSGLAKFRYKTMAQGLRNSPSTFQNLMDIVLKGIQFKYVMSYIDDLIIFSSTFDQHLLHIREVLTRVRKANLKLSPTKCKFALPKVQFLGHTLHQDGVSPNDDKLEAVKSYPTPTTLKQVRAFLGLTGFYRKFISKYAEVARPLYALTKKDTPFLWDLKCETAFQTLKNALTGDSVLAFPDFNKKFVLATDASNIGIGACLSQEHDGILKPIGYAGRAFNPAEKNYHTTDKELLAVVFGIQYFKVYLTGVPFEIHTDHAALRQILTSRDLEGRRARWVGFLQEYDFTPYHIKGKDNVIPDALSRRHYNHDHTKEDDVIDMYPDLYSINTDIPKDNSTLSTPPPIAITTNKTFDIQSQTPLTDPSPSPPVNNNPYSDKSPLQTSSRPPIGKQTHSPVISTTNYKPASLSLINTDIPKPTLTKPKQQHQPDAVVTAIKIPSIAAISKATTNKRKAKLHPHLDDSANKLLTELDLTVNRIRLTQNNDPELKPLIKYLKDNSLPADKDLARQIVLREEDYIILDDILYHIYVPPSQKSSKSVAQLVIPQDLKAYILALHHDAKLAGHIGIQRMLSVVKQRYYWKGMTKDIYEYVSTCKTCNQSKPANRSINMPLTIRDPAPGAFHTLYVDSVGPLVPTQRGNKHLVVVTDQYSRYVIAWPSRDVSAKTIAAQFYQKVICIYGAPKRLVSDNGAAFVGHIFKDLCSQFEIKQCFSTSYHPQAQGSVERANRSLINLLRNFVSSKQHDWDTFIAPLTFALNTSDNAPLGYSSYMLVFGKPPLLPSELHLIEPSSSNVTVQDHLTDILQTQAECHKYAMTHLQHEQDKMKQRYDANIRTANLKIGDIVYVYQSRLRVRNTKKKLQRSFHGPFIIVNFRTEKAVILRRVSDGKLLDKSVSIMRLKKGSLRAKTNDWDPITIDERNPDELLDNNDLPPNSLVNVNDDDPAQANPNSDSDSDSDIQDMPRANLRPRRKRLTRNDTMDPEPITVRTSKRSNKGRIARNNDFVY